MAILRIKNQTQYKISVPVAGVNIPPYGTTDTDLVDIDSFYNDPRIQRLMRPSTSQPHPTISVSLLQDSTPGSEGDAVLPFYAVGDLPAAASSSGMMAYNTSDEMVVFSDGVQWLALERIPTYAGGLPAAASVPASYLVFDKDNQTLWINSGSQWMLTMASGVESRASHQIPPPTGLPTGGLIFDTDNRQLKVNDGLGNWRLINNVHDYSTPAGLPTVTDVGFGALVYTSRDGTLWSRVGSSFIPCTGIIRFYATFGDLPTNATWGNDESGAIAYVHDIRTFLVWGGKNWRHLMTPETFTTATVPPTASGYIPGHIIYNSDTEQHLHSAGGAWEGIQGSARSYNAGLRPANASIPEGTTIWNSTSNKANFNIGGSWLDALGVVDP